MRWRQFPSNCLPSIHLSSNGEAPCAESPHRLVNKISTRMASFRPLPPLDPFIDLIQRNIYLEISEVRSSMQWSGKLKRKCSCSSRFESYFTMRILASLSLCMNSTGQSLPCCSGSLPFCQVRTGFESWPWTNTKSYLIDAWSASSVKKQF